jgi:hypothetical protein
MKQARQLLAATGWPTSRRVVRGLAVFAAAGLAAGPAPAGSIVVPNASFENPATDYADPGIASWQKKGKPPEFTEIGGLLWEWLTGVFRNTDPGSADHIVNCDGDQAAYLFNVPQVALFQDYGTIGAGETEPSHAFDAVYRVGHGYELTVGVIGGGGGMPAGAPLRIELYYRDEANERVPVAGTNVVHSPALFPTNTEFIDFSVEVPPVAADAPWAGEQIGIILISTVDDAMKGGYWDLDHVRLTEVAPVAIGAMETHPGEVQLTVGGEADAVLAIEAASALGPDAIWTPVGQVTNTNGAATFAAPATDSLRLYRVRQLP